MKQGSLVAYKHISRKYGTFPPQTRLVYAV
jgi:hypothetical protein